MSKNYVYIQPEESFAARHPVASGLLGVTLLGLAAAGIGHAVNKSGGCACKGKRKRKPATRRKRK